jgi:putative transposase
MPSQLKRIYDTADLHFVTFSCYHRQPNLSLPPSRDLFLSVIEQVRLRYRFDIIGYVVMPEHVHLLLSKPEHADLSVAIQVLKQTVSRKSSSTAAFWQRRFYDFNVRTEAKRREKLRYMHQNPVTRGLVESPEDWQWSSFRHYAFEELSLVIIDSSWLNVWRQFVNPTLRKSAKDGAPEHLL